MAYAPPDSPGGGTVGTVRSVERSAMMMHSEAALKANTTPGLATTAAVSDERFNAAVGRTIGANDEGATLPRYMPPRSTEVGPGGDGFDGASMAPVHMRVSTQTSEVLRILDRLPSAGLQVRELRRRACARRQVSSPAPAWSYSDCMSAFETHGVLLPLHAQEVRFQMPYSANLRFQPSGGTAGPRVRHPTALSSPANPGPLNHLTP